MTNTATATGRDHRRPQIAAALERLHRAVAGKPRFGRSTSSSATTLGVGVRCTTVERSITIDSDLSPALGGERSAPSPGMHLRSALGACLAMRYEMLAVERGIELTAVCVTVEEESDVRGLLFDDADAPPGPIALRYHVEIESPADHDIIVALVDAGDRLSPVLDALLRPQEVERTITITTGTTTTGTITTGED